METATVTLTDFLLARIAEDEEMAEAVHRGRWNSRVALLDPDLYGHVIRQHPDRILAECEAKRGIVALHDDLLKRELDHRDQSAFGADLMHGDVLRALAAVYADHPDYREEWKP